MNDVDCPYCGEEMEVCQDDGHACAEGIEEEECPNCGKTFLLSVTISYDFDGLKADCLNDITPHKWNMHPARDFSWGHKYCSECDTSTQMTNDDLKNSKEKEQSK